MTPPQTHTSISVTNVIARPLDPSLMPAPDAKLRLTPAVPITIGILAGMTSCGIASSTLKTTDIWPGPVIGGLTGYLAYLCLNALPLPAALRELARDESAPRHRSRWPWRAAVVAWLVAMVACVAFALAVMLGLPPKERGSVPFIDVGFGFGLFLGIPIAIGVLLLGHRDEELVSPDEQPEAVPATLPAAATPAPARAGPAMSVELAAAIAGLAGMSSCVISVWWLSIWFAPLASIVFAILLFRAMTTPATAGGERPAAKRMPWRVPAASTAAGTDARLPWAIAAGAWIACAVVGALSAYRMGYPATPPLSRLAEGLGQGALLGIPVAAWILWFGRPRPTWSGTLGARRKDS